MQVICDLPIRTCPVIEGGIVHVSMSSGTSQVYVETENFIAVDFMTHNGSIQFHIFLNRKRAGWDDLNDEQRMLMRVGISTYIADHWWDKTMISSKYCPGEYEDKRYYTLEALT